MKLHDMEVLNMKRTIATVIFKPAGPARVHIKAEFKRTTAILYVNHNLGILGMS